MNFLQWFRSSSSAPVYSQLSTTIPHLHNTDDDKPLPPPPPPPIKTRRKTLLILAALAMLLLSSMLYQYAFSPSDPQQQQPSPSLVHTKYLFVTASSPFALQQACQQYQLSSTTTQIFLTAQHLLDQLQRDIRVCGVLSFSVQWHQVLQAMPTLRVVTHHETDAWQAIFDLNFSLWTRELVSSSIEEEIDESCLTRRITEMRKLNCDALEIPVIRAAIFRTLLLKHQQDQFKTATTNLITANPAAVERMQQLIHTALHKQLSTWIFAPLPALSETRQLPVIDAGACIQVSNTTDKTDTGPSAQCLPSFVIIGAQKSGTDELSVYLNRNTYANRRMDGGIELHFFDCVGRGLGNIKDEQDRFRLSCDRMRTGRMNSNNPAGPLSSLQAFTWRNVSKTSPYVEELYPHYMQLGQLTYKQYTKEHRTLLFEKSPSYIDMANPRDVVRVLPRAKFVFLSRDPVPRLVSAYFQYCETYDIARAAQNCTIEEFDMFARALANGELDVTTQDDSLPRRQAFHRGALYGMYDKYFQDWLKYFWVDSSMQVRHPHSPPETLTFS